MEKLADISIFNSLARTYTPVDNGKIFDALNRGRTKRKKAAQSRLDELTSILKGMRDGDGSIDDLQEYFRIQNLIREAENNPLLQEEDYPILYTMGQLGGSTVSGTTKAAKFLGRLLKAAGKASVEGTKNLAKGTVRKGKAAVKEGAEKVIQGTKDAAKGTKTKVADSFRRSVDAFRRGIQDGLN